MITELQVKNLLIKLGVRPVLLGYEYLADAIMRYSNRTHIHMVLVNGLYTDVAQDYGTTVSRVERAMRHAIIRSYANVPDDLKQDIFSNTVPTGREHPTLGNYIAALATYLQLQEETSAGQYNCLYSNSYPHKSEEVL